MTDQGEGMSVTEHIRASDVTSISPHTPSCLHSGVSIAHHIIHYISISYRMLLISMLCFTWPYRLG